MYPDMHAGTAPVVHKVLSDGLQQVAPDTCHHFSVAGPVTTDGEASSSACAGRGALQ